MLTLTGIIHGVYMAPVGTNKEGKQYGGGWKVQLICDEQLENGYTRSGIQTLTADPTYAKWFEQNIGQEVSLPVGVIAAARNALTFFIGKAWRPPAPS